MSDAPILRLPVLPEDVTTRSDRFRCEPYRITVTANTCCQRRAMVRAGLKKLEFLHCGEGCHLGNVVEKNSGGPLRVMSAVTDAKNGWDLQRAEKFGQVFEGQTPRTSVDKEEKRREYARRYQRERYQRQKAAKGAAGPKLTTVAGGRVEPDEPTIPTLGDSMPIAQPLPKAPPGRRPPSYPPSALQATRRFPGPLSELERADVEEARKADINPEVRAGGIAGTTIQSSGGGLMVHRPWLPPSGPFPDLETAARAAGSIEAVETRRVSDIEAPASKGKKETTMPICTHEGCKKITRPGKFKEPPPPGTEGFCKRHRKEFLKGEAPGPTKARAKPAKKAGRAKPGPKPKAARREVSRLNGAATVGNVRGHIEQALEDHELVERVGRELVLALAQRIDQARAEA